MMREHCDRCEVLIDDFPKTSVRVSVAENQAFIDVALVTVWHVEISSGELIRGQAFCRRCRIAILEAHVDELKEMA
jgi:hypothetical protein